MENRSLVAPHSCCLYHTNSEQAAIVGRFIYDGLSRHEKVLSIINPWDTGGFLHSYSHDDFDLASAIRKGHLRFPTITDTYLRTSPFHPAHMIQRLHHETTQALEHGYTGLRVTADMTWALHYNIPLQTLVAYETQVDNFLRHHPCTGLCRYDRFHFSHTMLEDLIPIHASIFIHDREYTNTTHTIFSDILRDFD